jgi:hypothetical protein
MEPPTTSFPKLRLDVPSDSVGVALAPVPLKGSVSVEFVAVLFSVTLPVTLPDVVGANPSVKLAVCDGASVSDNGLARPLTLNPAPLSVSPEIVKLVPPVFFS